MSSNKVLELISVGKMYPIYEKPSDRLKQLLWGRFLKCPYGREHWAVRDISFHVMKGEAVGLMGANGAGKSTILQLVCGTLEPSCGTIYKMGRIASLLELGSGFNPDFTGKENVLLNAVILGLSETEAYEKYDDILAFADIGEFISQPVRTYSSGMTMRLAFSVVAHLDPDILIVDEALSVGDYFFQAKCIDRIQKMRSKGTTLLFVSHDSATVKGLCDRAILIDKGRLVLDSSPSEVTEKYFSIKVAQSQPIDPRNPASPENISQSLLKNIEEFQKLSSFERQRNGKADFLNVQLLNEKNEISSEVPFGENLTLRLLLRVNEDIPILCYGYHIRDHNGYDIIYSDSVIENSNLIGVTAGSVFIIDWKFKAHLSDGRYNISIVCSIPIDLSQSQVLFCDFIPIASQFNVSIRQPTRIYARAYWSNQVSIKRIPNSTI